MTRDVDGGLDAADRARLEAHAAACAACREAWAAQQTVARLVRARPSADVPPGFAARVAARLDEPETWFGLAEWRAWTWRLVPVAVALFVVAAVVGHRATGTTAQASPTRDVIVAAEPASTDAQPEAVLWEDGITQDQLLLTVLTGRRQSATMETRHE
jgi:predicted anti-sigma-YlaC factor YlaD